MAVMQTLCVQMVCCRNLFNVDISDIFNILVWNFIPRVLSSVYLLYGRDEALQVSDFVTTQGHRERWLHFYADVIIMKTKLKHPNAVLSQSVS